jgi:histidine kinase
MKRFTGRLWTRLLAAQLLIIALGAVTLIVLVELLAPTFFSNDLRTMNSMMADPSHMGDMMGDMATGSSSTGLFTPTVQADLEASFDSSFRRALAISLVVAGIAAIGTTAYATRRILRPLQAVRSAAHKLAAGAYDQRIDLPNEEELADLAQDVNALAEALATTEARRVRLISEVAHELRTPLTTLEGYLEGLLDGVFEPNAELYAASGREVRRLKRLAADLADLSRAEEESQPLHLELFDLTALAGEVTADLRVQADAKGIRLNVTQDGEQVAIRADRDRIGQALTNIIGNAITYTDSGGSVDINIEIDAHHARIEVTDTGRGLSTEQQTAIFERFYRGDPNGPGGSGIGLTIARAIARRHGGEIEANSPGTGKGSTFTIRLARHMGPSSVTEDFCGLFKSLHALIILYQKVL